MIEKDQESKKVYQGQRSSKSAPTSNIKIIKQFQLRPRRRVSSPDLGASTLMTSAPMSAISIVAEGPGSILSTLRSPKLQTEPGKCRTLGYPDPEVILSLVWPHFGPLWNGCIWQVLLEFARGPRCEVLRLDFKTPSKCHRTFEVSSLLSRYMSTLVPNVEVAKNNPQTQTNLGTLLRHK
jgi:hypothetical protein